MPVAAITLEHDHAEYFDVGDIVEIGSRPGVVGRGRVLHVDVPGERITVDVFGPIRLVWLKFRLWVRDAAA